jgi:hypothetical protein
VASATATLGETLASAPSTSSTEWNHRPLPPRGDRGGLHARDPLPSSTPVRCLAARLAERAEGAQVLALRLCSPVEAPDVVLPVHHGEVSPRSRLVGRAGTASPCRPGMHLGTE